MATIEGQILIGRPVEEVFDFVADSRNEPSFNPAMAGVELLTPLLTGRGTRFRARNGPGGHADAGGADRVRPAAPARLAHSQLDDAHLRGLTVAAGGDGTVMSWDWQVRPTGWMRMLGPLSGPLGGRMERRIWTSLKRYLENTVARPVTRPAP
jgi:hypothetical protein